MDSRVDADALLRALWEGVPIAPSGEVKDTPFLLTHFREAISPSTLVQVATLIAELVPCNLSALVGVAERSVGCLVHLVAQLKGNLPYSLANWYPVGSVGDIEIDASAMTPFGGQKGHVLLNGLSSGDRVLLMHDFLTDSTPLLAIIHGLEKHGVIVVGTIVVADYYMDETVPRPFRKLCATVPLSTSLCTVHGARSTASRVVRTINLLVPLCVSMSSRSLCQSVASLPTETAELEAMFQLVLDSFVGIPIFRPGTGEEGYPYSRFALTDGYPLLAPRLVENIADACVYLIHQQRSEEGEKTTSSLRNATVLVSEADRGGAPMAVALARRMGLPLVLATWETHLSASTVAAENTPPPSVAASVGYSGHGSLVVGGGISPQSRCVVVDDMLSSGGTCEALFEAIEREGGVVLGALFASEKVTTKGRERLRKRWPSVHLCSVCYFEAIGEQTSVAPPPLGANDTPLQASSEDAETSNAEGAESQDTSAPEKRPRECAPSKRKDGGEPKKRRTAKQK